MEELENISEKLDVANSNFHSHDKEIKILEQDKKHIQEKFLSKCKKFDEVDKRCKDAEREAKRAVELADIARAEAVAAQKEKSEAQHLAMERFTQIERAERQVESLEREKARLMEEAERLRLSERDAVSKVSLLETRVDEREREIDEMLNQNSEQRSSTVQLLVSLLATERAALAEANSRAEALSLQLQATQGKLDALQQELTSVRLNETALDSKLKTARGKRFRTDDHLGTESVHDLNPDDEESGRKRSRSTSGQLKYNQTADGGSVYRGEEDVNKSQENTGNDSGYYKKLTVLQLKQELTKHGFGGHLLQLRNPLKKEIVALYEILVLKK